MAKIRDSRWMHRAEAKATTEHPQVQRQLDEAEALTQEDIDALLTHADEIATAVNEAYLESEAKAGASPELEDWPLWLYSQDDCKTCDGSGILDSEWECHQCDGTGRV